MARLLIVVGCFGSIYVAMTYSLGNALIELITNYETSRPMLISEAFNYYDFTLFGQEVNLISSSEINEVVGAYAVLDNAYIFLILEFGVINTIWVVGLYLLGIRKMRNSDFQDYRIETLTLSIVGYLFIAITEKYTFDLFYNYTLFIIAYQLYGATYVSDDESEYLFEEKA
ncbi:MAG: hypothetical protein LUH07_00680 [Lachnospiraceae bacterium]|nr:hypothetical protein [Lachnospiraceae bacterium]